VPAMLDHLIEQLADDAKTLGCAEELLACRKIVTGGTSADAQLRVFRAQQNDPPAAIDSVVRWIADASTAA
jgi:carboxylate-amine ligase